MVWLYLLSFSTHDTMRWKRTGRKNVEVTSKKNVTILLMVVVYKKLGGQTGSHCITRSSRKINFQSKTRQRHCLCGKICILSKCPWQQVCRRSTGTTTHAVAACRWSRGSFLRRACGALSSSLKGLTVRKQRSCKLNQCNETKVSTWSSNEGQCKQFLCWLTFKASNYFLKVSFTNNRTKKHTKTFPQNIMINIT